MKCVVWKCLHFHTTFEQRAILFNHFKEIAFYCTALIERSFDSANDGEKIKHLMCTFTHQHTAASNGRTPGSCRIRPRWSWNPSRKQQIKLKSVSTQQTRTQNCLSQKTWLIASLQLLCVCVRVSLMPSYQQQQQQVQHHRTLCVWPSVYYQPSDSLLSDLQNWSMSNILEACGVFNLI